MSELLKVQRGWKTASLDEQEAPMGGKREGKGYLLN